MSPNTASTEPRLDPLAFPAETDMRFLLLIFAAAGTTIGLADFALYTYVQYLPIDHSYDELISIYGALLALALLFLIAYRRAARAADRLIARRALREFPPATGDPLELQSLRAMATYVAQIVAGLPAVAAQQPRFYWNNVGPDSRSPSGMAFGFRRRQAVCLNSGLHDEFVAAPTGGRLNAVLLHELGHLANRDVSRTTFSIELGRTFTQAALLLVALTVGYLGFHVLRRLIGGTLADEHTRAFGLIFQFVTSTAAVIALIEIVRASVLRAREYYADERARQWLGDEAPLRALLARREPESARHPMPSGMALGIMQRARRGQAIGGNPFRRYLAPLHPSHRQRVATLAHPQGLFGVELWAAFLAGVISGVALNANNILLSQVFGLAVLSNNLLSALLNQPMGAVARSIIFLVSTLLSLLTVLVLLGLFAFLFAGPLAGSVGLSVQRAAFADSLARGRPALLPLRRLALCALLLGTGIVLGGTLTPSSGALTLRPKDLPLVPLFVAGWAGVSLLWLLPLRWVAGRAYRSHAGTRPPLLRRRWLTGLSALAITPLLLATMFAQGGVTSLGVVALPPEGVAFLIGAWIFSLAFSLAVWGLGALLMGLAGWFGPPSCPGCGRRASKATALHCTHCGQPLRAWALTPPPLSLPAPPPPPQTFSETPPPL